MLNSQALNRPNDAFLNGKHLKFEDLGNSLKLLLSFSCLESSIRR